MDNAINTLLLLRGGEKKKEKKKASEGCFSILSLLLTQGTLQGNKGRCFHKTNWWARIPAAKSKKVANEDF